MASKAHHDDYDGDEDAWETFDPEVEHETSLLAEEAAARRCIRTFNLCAVLPAAGLVAFAIWAEQFAFGPTAQFLVWTLSGVGVVMFFLTFVGCVGSVKGATKVLLVVSSPAAHACLCPPDSQPCTHPAVLHGAGFLCPSTAHSGRLLLHLRRLSDSAREGQLGPGAG